VALAIVAALVCPLVPCLVARLKATEQYVESLNGVRVRELNEHIGRSTRQP
jgi:hypothetical protein